MNFSKATVSRAHLLILSGLALSSASPAWAAESVAQAQPAQTAAKETPTLNFTSVNLGLGGMRARMIGNDIEGDNTHLEIDHRFVATPGNVLIETEGNVKADLATGKPAGLPDEASSASLGLTGNGTVRAGYIHPEGLGPKGMRPFVAVKAQGEIGRSATVHPFQEYPDAETVQGRGAGLETGAYLHEDDWLARGSLSVDGIERTYRFINGTTEALKAIMTDPDLMTVQSLSATARLEGSLRNEFVGKAEVSVQPHSLVTSAGVRYQPKKFWGFARPYAALEVKHVALSDRGDKTLKDSGFSLDGSSATTYLMKAGVGF